MRRQITTALIAGVFLSWMGMMLLPVRLPTALGRVVFIFALPGIYAALRLWGMDAGATKFQNDSTILIVNALILSCVCFAVFKIASLIKKKRADFSEERKRGSSA